MVSFLSRGVEPSPHGEMQPEQQLVVNIGYVGVLEGKACLRI
jgi:hypothetical protein